MMARPGIATRSLALAALLLLGPQARPTPAAFATAPAADCEAISAWVDYLHAMVDRQQEITQREVELSRDRTQSPDELAPALAAVGAEREAAIAEFLARPPPPEAQAVYTAYSLAWELDAQVARAYLQALRSGDERQRGLADGYTEASGTIAARADTLLSALLASCDQ